MSMKIGVDHLMYSLMTTEDTVTTAAVYAPPVAAPGVMSVNINPNGSQDTAFGDNGPMETATTLGKIEVEIKKSALPTGAKADLLGHGVDTKGGLVYGAEDVPPWTAIGFRSLKSNGKYRYVWLYKGKFMEPEDTNETKADSINFQPDTIKGQFAYLNKPVVVDGKARKVYKYEADEEDAGIDAAMLAAWFTAVVLPTADV